MVRGSDGDPAADRDRERQSITVVELGARFMKEHVAVRCKPTTQSEYKRSVELFINPFFGKQRARTVTPADVAELQGSQSHIPYQANLTLGGSVENDRPCGNMGHSGTSYQSL